MVTTHTTVQDDAFTLTEDELMMPLRQKSILRASGIYPIKTIAQPEDLITYYWKVVDDFNLKYSMEPYDSPRSDNALTKTSVNLPAIHGLLHWGYDQMKRVDRQRLKTDDIVRNAINNIAREEESIAFSGAAQDVTVTSVSNASNATAASTEFNTASIANIHSTLTGLIGQLIDSNIDPKAQPLKFVMTNDVYKNALGRINTDQNMNGIQYIQKLLTELGGTGSSLHMSPFLGGTRGVGAKKATYTAGTTNACLFAVSSQFYEIVASPIDQRADPISKISGYSIQYVERFVPIYKEPLAIIYSGTVANA